MLFLLHHNMRSGACTLTYLYALVLLSFCSQHACGYVILNTYKLRTTCVVMTFVMHQPYCLLSMRMCMLAT